MPVSSSDDSSPRGTEELDLARPAKSQTRFLVLACLCSLTFILYLDRVCISQAATSIRAELGLTKTQMGWVFGAFSISYSLFEVVTGHWGDRFGVRQILTRIVLWWSAFTILTGCVPRFDLFGSSAPAADTMSPGGTTAVGEMAYLGINSLSLMILVRFLFGAGEAGALPCSARVVTQWFPRREKGMMIGLTLLCMNLGGALAPVLSARLIQSVGWRWTFACFGLIGVIWSAIFYWWYRDQPAEHGQVSIAERNLILSDRDQTSPTQGGHDIPWSIVVVHPVIWLMGIIQACSSFTSYLFMNWYATYLKEGRGLAEISSGVLTTQVMICGAVGSILGGFVSRRIDHSSHPALYRKLCGCAALVTGGICLGIAPHLDELWQMNLMMSVVSFLTISQQANWWTVLTLIGGRHVAALFGFCNGLGGFGSFFSPVFFGWFVDRVSASNSSPREQFDPAFFPYAIILALGGLCWLGVGSYRPVNPLDSAPHDAARSPGH